MTVALVANIARPISSAISNAFSADSYGKLDAYGKLGVTDPDAAIKALFANSEIGVWSDHSNLSTMFQSGDGTPFTTVGQTVGLILDNSKGLVLGSEKVVNGTFDNSSWWTAFLATWTVGSGVCSATNESSYFYCVDILTVGKVYRYSIDIVRSAGSINVCQSRQISTSGTATGVFVATSANLLIIGNSFTGSVDNLSIKEVTGNHAIQATAGSRPVVANNVNTKPFRDFDLVDDNMVTTFPSSLGSTCTVGRSSPTDGAVILTNQTIGTTYTANADDCALVITNDALTTQETADLTDWLNKKAGFFL